MKKILLLSAMCLMAFSVSAQKYVDLGLPSGTKWKTTNETNPNDKNNFYTYDEAVSKFGKSLPTKAQLDELQLYCEWIWEGRGYKVVGPNGNFIYLPAAGNRDCLGSVFNVDSIGCYWSSTLDGSEKACCILLYSRDVFKSIKERYYGFSVRLIQY